MTTAADAIARLDAPFDFKHQPSPLSGALRPLRRIPLVLLLVAKYHGSTTNWKGLQVLSWAIRDDSNLNAYLAFAQQGGAPDRPIVRFEPALERAVDLAAGLGLLEYTPTAAIHLTERGSMFVASLIPLDVFRAERTRLDRIPGRVTRAHVDQLLDWRSR